jgi:hypothetical protein
MFEYEGFAPNPLTLIVNPDAEVTLPLYNKRVKPS